jgi:putative NADH-flavin reductase
MTAPESAAVIVLGAAGRLGRELLPLLADGSHTTVGVVRDRKPDLTRPDLHWMQVNVTERELWQRSLLALSGIASMYDRTVVVDLVLDRTTVSSMRRSITDATDYVHELIGVIEERGSTPLLVAASTTAILAPQLYQTPYGLAKRNQVEVYAALPAAQIMLLPVLKPPADSADRMLELPQGRACDHASGQDGHRGDRPVRPALGAQCSTHSISRRTPRGSRHLTSVCPGRMPHHRARRPADASPRGPGATRSHPACAT